MKKIFTMAAIALFMMTSCSDDDSSSTNEQSSKLTKVVTTDSEGVFTSNLSYDGNKLILITNSDGTKSVITYAGDLVKEWKSIDVTSNEVLWKDVFEYNSQNQLITYYQFDFEENYHEKNVFIHNTDGTIKYTEYSSTEEDLDSFTQKTWEGTITSTTRTMVTPSMTEVLTYAYDGKNHPFKNITGFNKIGFAINESASKDHIENVVSQSYTPNGSTEVRLENTSTYTYNSANYPVVKVDTNVSDPTETATTQYTY